MSRMALLDGSLWFSLVAPRAPNGTAKPGDGGYPPYNLELLHGSANEPEALRITLAVAGFAVDQLEVSIESGSLTIGGRQHEDAAKDYLHRGIAARQFKRTFQLASGVEVRGAELNDGLLAIELVRPRKEKRVLRVGIAAAD
jgi:HSP20 family molecular chaperone IbpA